MTTKLTVLVLQLYLSGREQGMLEVVKEASSGLMGSSP